VSYRLIATGVMDSVTIRSWLQDIAESMRAERDHLVALDSAIGDGDHGINMTRGFDAVEAAIAAEPEATPGRLLILTGKTLVSTVGGASGPLWGSALRAAGRTLGDRAVVEPEQLVEALAAALAAVRDLGAAALGDKTMVDALEPAVAALRSGLASGQPLAAALDAAVAAAEEGMRATVPMQARKGRASYLGERSIGHQDPGATSTALIVSALRRAHAGVA
jgi:phosphoenolpyruvate---glycerone phosphotransferase subunit DhaL